MYDLAGLIDGEVLTDDLHRIVYATDSSAYREFPAGVVVPAGVEDLRKIVTAAARRGVPLITRGAGTSLAGQVVGGGVVIDMRRFDKILALDAETHRVTVQPGVIRNVLNAWLAPHGLQFGPETSTANRAVIGGMIGNNSCGAHSLVWGSTRDHLVSCRVLLADGTETEFKALTPEDFHRKRKDPGLEGQIYETLFRTLSDKTTRDAIVAEYPKPSITRRNHGYALDLLLRSNVFTPGGPDFNMCSLIAGSEGTLCLVTEATLNLVPVPPPVTGCVTVHLLDTIEAMRATLIALRHNPMSCELIGDFAVRQIIENNKTNKHNMIALSSQWIEGRPKAIIVVEFSEATREAVEARAARMVADLKAQAMGYAWPLWFGEDVDRIWALRRSLGGVLSSRPSDIKPFDLIEDCAVDVDDQPEYVQRLEEILNRAGVEFTHAAHAGHGELHTTVFLNPKTSEGIRQFRAILEQVSGLVKGFRGSLSGEHGDGRLRSEFLPRMIGPVGFAACRAVKQAFDGQGILNPHKIIDAEPMDVSLRYSPDVTTPDIPTYFNWDKDKGILRAMERCNGVAECKKTTGGLMCPSYMATREEKDSTRARANVLREFLTNSPRENRFDHREIWEVLSLCLSCKGCKSECPATVDIARAKAEFLQHYYDAHRPRARVYLIAHFASLMRLAALAAPVFNALVSNRMLAAPVKKLIGFAPERSIPRVRGQTLARWYRRNRPHGDGLQSKGVVHLFCDEFTNLNDARVGVAACLLLSDLGYRVDLVQAEESGRAMISQGFLKKAKEVASRNVALLKDRVTDDAPLIVLEPSVASCFKDEYPDLVAPALREDALALSRRGLMFEEFIAREMDRGAITPDSFTDAKRAVHVHVHCHQKALSSSDTVVRVLSLPRNYTVTHIPSGCCGMAGGFGYEAEHVELSMRIGEQVLFPAVRAAGEDAIIAASGTSCRHQISDGTGRCALHTAEILYDALRRE